MTRLRFILNDENIVNDDEVKAIKGVVGVTKKAGQYQIIIGNDVAKCYKELQNLGNFGDGAEGKSENKEKQNPLMVVLDVISGCMAPVIPAIIGAGMIRVLLIVLGFWFSPESQTMQLLTVIGDCSFYFLPILVAFSAGKKFNTNPFLHFSTGGRRDRAGSVRCQYVVKKTFGSSLYRQRYYRCLCGNYAFECILLCYPISGIFSTVYWCRRKQFDFGNYNRSHRDHTFLCTDMDSWL